jgi:hypothetical protein
LAYRWDQVEIVEKGTGSGLVMKRAAEDEAVVVKR